MTSGPAATPSFPADLGLPDSRTAPRPLDKYDGPALAASQGSLQRFHVMVKPGGCACNLKCAYCFYLHKADLLGAPGGGRMSDETLQRLVAQYIEGVTGDEVVFSWQGGEPTILGLDFYRKVVELEKVYARPGQTIENDLQTNGTLIDEEWCEFLKANRFLVGLSIDGPKNLHDHYRVTRDGRSTFESVMNAAQLLRRHGIPFNTLTCVHRGNARYPLDVYRFLRREVGSTYMQFTPIVEYRDFERAAPQAWNWDSMPRDGSPEARPGHPNSVLTDWSVDPDEWGYFLSKAFDEWRKRDVGRVLVNQFETLVAQHMGLPSQLCVYGEFCGKGVAVEQDGSVYSCDHYVYPEHKIGSVHSGRLGDIVLDRPQVKFGYAKNETLPGQCRQCSYLNDCWGECPKNRILRTADGEPGLNYLCRGLKAFYAHAVPEVETIVAGLRKRAIQPRMRM